MKLLKKIAEHSGAVYALSYHPELNILWSGGADKVVASWDLNDFSNTPLSIKTQSAILNLCQLDPQHLFIGLFNGHFHIIDVLTKKELKHITFHKKGIFSSAVSHQHHKLIVGSGDGVVSIWNSLNFELLKSEKICDGKIRSIQVVGSFAFIGTSDGLLLKIDLESLHLVNSYILEQEGINSICYLPDKNSLLLGGKNASLMVFNLELEKIILQFPAHNWPIYDLQVIPSFGLFSCSRDKTIKNWNSESLEVIKRYCYPEFKAHTHSVNKLLFIPEHQLLVSAGDDKALCIWKMD